MKLSLKSNTAVFVDAGVENYQQLIDGVLPEVKPFLLSAAADGIEQIDKILHRHPEINTVHIISHGSPGCVYLGNSQLSLDALHRYASQLQQWKLDNLFLYGCNVAAGDGGEEFVAKLQGLTGAEIAASRTLTGAAVRGGNWELEVTTGKMQHVLPLQPEAIGSYAYVLNPQLEWARKIGGNKDDSGVQIVTDSNDNVLVTGYFRGYFGNTIVRLVGPKKPNATWPVPNYGNSLMGITRVPWGLDSPPLG